MLFVARSLHWAPWRWAHTVAARSPHMYHRHQAANIHRKFFMAVIVGVTLVGGCIITEVTNDVGAIILV